MERSPNAPQSAHHPSPRGWLDWFDALPGVPEVTGTARVNALDLRDEPEKTARLLIERWLPQFYRDEHVRDPFEVAVPGRP
jgi:hypothetical protein